MLNQLLYPLLSLSFMRILNSPQSVTTDQTGLSIVIIIIQSATQAQIRDCFFIPHNKHVKAPHASAPHHNNPLENILKKAYLKYFGIDQQELIRALRFCNNPEAVNKAKALLKSGDHEFYFNYEDLPQDPIQQAPIKPTHTNGCCAIQ